MSTKCPRSAKNWSLKQILRPQDVPTRTACRWVNPRQPSTYASVVRLSHGLFNSSQNAHSIAVGPVGAQVQLSEISGLTFLLLARANLAQTSMVASLLGWPSPLGLRARLATWLAKKKLGQEQLPLFAHAKVYACVHYAFGSLVWSISAMSTGLGRHTLWCPAFWEAHCPPNSYTPSIL